MAMDSSTTDSWTPLSARRIGLVSDTHGDVLRTTRGLDLLIADSVDLILHLGDLGSEAVVDRLAGLPVRLVLGNVDPPHLARYATLIGLTVDHPGMRLQVGERRIFATHGHLDSVVRSGLSDRPDYFIHGHTHQARDERIDGIRFLNPGAVQRGAPPSVAILDPVDDDFTVRHLPEH
ncbi:MAG: hypothetical protein CMJ51_01840 [Planctomycetaceae bacterium]|nr:hypothetical protein [Planctomycetaceae bacterium]